MLTLLEQKSFYHKRNLMLCSIKKWKTCRPRIVFVSSISVSTGDESFVIKLRDSKQQTYCTVCHEMTLIIPRTDSFLRVLFPKTDTFLYLK